MGLDFQNASRRKHCVGMHIMIGCGHGLVSAGHATPRKRADLHLGLGVQGNVQGGRVLSGLRVNLLQVLEDGIGLGSFF